MTRPGVIVTCALVGGLVLGVENAPILAGVDAESRTSLIARSKVWNATDIPTMNLALGPQGPGAFEADATVECDYVNRKLSGASPKFACRTADGQELKVKYGGANGEVYGEVAASRLLWALGFGADHMYQVRVICHKCPERLAGSTLRTDGNQLVDPAAVERKFPGKELADKWKWSELDQVSESAGGASRAERDAFKLLAALIQHSDSKPIQQRLVCAEGSEVNGRCGTPLMMINDLGVTFGRAATFNQQGKASVNLARWREAPVWKDPSGCVANLSGSLTGTLKNPVISEEGRQFLAGLLTQLSDDQIRDMFSAARVNLRLRVPGSGESGFASVDEWVNAFKEKRTAIADRRCD